MYWNLTVGGLNQRATGCPGLDEPFSEMVIDGAGTVFNWHMSPAMKCGLNEYTPIDRPMHEIVDELASDNEVFAEKFLEGWQMMTNNGYNKVL